MQSKMHYKIVIVGGGSGGISTAARLLKASHNLRGQVAVIDPSDKHYYQPLWTLVGAGEVKKQVTQRAEASVIPNVQPSQGAI